MKLKIAWKWLITLAAITTQFVSTEEIPNAQTEADLEVNKEWLAEEIPKVIQEFNEMILLSSTSKTKTSRGFTNVEFCIGTKQELDLIMEKIGDSKSDKNDLEFQMIASSYCREIDEIKKDILLLKYDFKQVTKNPLSSEMYEKLKTKCKTQLEQLKKRMTDPDKLVRPEEIVTYLDLLEKVLSQDIRINTILKYLDQKHKTVDKKDKE